MAQRILHVTASAAAVFVLAACTGGTGDDPRPTAPKPPAPFTTSEEPGQTTTPSGPPERRWVGMDGVVVAVPADWGTVVQPCGEPDGDIVFFLGASSLSLDCGSVPTDGVSSLTIASASSGVIHLGKRVDLGRRINGLPVLSSGVTCRKVPNNSCSLTFTVTGTDAAFHVVSQGQQARAFVEAVQDSVVRLWARRTTVPFIDYGTSVVEARQQLVDAHLRVQSPQVNFPHYVTGTQPPAGSVVAVGRTVELLVGDG